jgi:hypothetical protein
MVLTDWPAFGGDLPADLIKSGIAISGIFDLEPIRHTPIGDKPGAGKTPFGGPFLYVKSITSPRDRLGTNLGEVEGNGDFVQAWTRTRRGRCRLSSWRRRRLPPRRRRSSSHWEAQKEPSSIGRETIHVIVQTEHLPRQDRDKHRRSGHKRTVSAGRRRLSLRI